MTTKNSKPEGSAETATGATDETHHSAERAIIAARRAKAERVRARGEMAFANDVGPKSENARSLDIASVRDLASEVIGEGGRYDTATVERAAGDAPVHVTGRVIAFRSTGALSFLKLRDHTDEIQLLASQADMQSAYAALEDIDVGDIVEAEGKLSASKRGELSVVTSRVRLVTKAYRPLPEKWHGLTDVETRYRQRYVDLIANPHVADVFRARSVIVQALRAVLDAEGFLEVETPSMHTLIGGAAAKPFVTHHNTLDMRLFMRIAPELYLKRLLVGGLGRVYEIGRCYRNEGISTRHNPEFTMLEFYWAFATYETLMDFTEHMLRDVDAHLQMRLPDAHAKWKSERPFSLDAPFIRISMNDAVVRAARATQIADFQPLVENGNAQPLVSRLSEEFVDEIKPWSKSSPRAKKLDWSNFRKGLQKCDNDGERLFALYEYLAEPFLPDDFRTSDGAQSVPVFIKDYPFETSPLARKNDDNPGLVDRFELFVHGRELCNAFSELNDPDDQSDRFREQVAKKGRGAEETMDYDDDYVRALEHGMPPAAGFGMGVDRLVMMLTSSPSIRDVILFPLLRPEAE